MEVETHSHSGFDLSSKTLSYANSKTTDPSELRNQVLRSSELPWPSDAPEPEALESPTAGGGKCEGMSDTVVLFSSSGATCPTSNCRECKGLVASVGTNLNDTMEKFPSDAAMKVQKVYRSYRTRRMLADSAVVAEELWWQVLDYARLNHSTISFFNFLKPESVASRWNRVGLNASKVGKGLSKDAKAQKLAFQHWIEAIDPRHRYGHSLHIYYEEWCKAEAGQPFFYWLDLGDGKEVDLEECPRSKLREQCIKYLGPQEREHYEYMVVEGKIVHKQTGNLLDTSAGKPGAKWIFVMSTSKRLYAGEKRKGSFHHSSFLAGGATLAAGRVVVEDGVLKSISAYSGHYRPTDDTLDIFLQILRENGVNLDDVEIKKPNEDYETSEEGKSTKGESNSVVSTVFASRGIMPLNEVEENTSKFAIELPEANATYKRTLSGGLRSPKADVPKTALLQRINSKKVASSYQLGNQLSLKWSTGAGPRIGCIADYPMELRWQALELTHLSPRPSLPSFAPVTTPGRMSPLHSCPAQQLQQLVNGDIKSC